MNPAAAIPALNNADDAGLDLQTMESVTLMPGQLVCLPTGLAFEMPTGLYGRIEPRSKLANKKGLDVLAGVIDKPYTSEVHTVIINHGHDPIEYRKGDRIVQMVIKETFSGLKIEEVNYLTETPRGGSGINETELRL